MRLRSNLLGSKERNPLRLFIAEKPSVAKAIAAELGVTRQGQGLIQCGSTTLTWCFGHMLELAEPDLYTPDSVPRTSKGRKVWREQELPILPVSWKLLPKPDAKAQLKVIGSLVKRATEIVNAGDPDREGQLLVDEVLEHFQALIQGVPVRRFWVSAQDKVSIQRGLARLQDNRAFLGMAQAARARQRADWLVGMNLSRAYTLKAKRGGSRVLLTVGRVQTPTLALVVARDREIEAFKPTAYHVIAGEFEHPQGRFQAIWQPKEDQSGVDEEGRLLDRQLAEAIVAKVAGQRGEVGTYRQERKRELPPLAFSLSDLTVLASRRFGYRAEDVLRACQSLYETHKLISYPRTDCPYLPQSQHRDAPQVLSALAKVNPDMGASIAKADPRLKSRVWNDRKVTAHHGIVPTMHVGRLGALKESERRIYDLVVRQYLAQFYPPHEYLSTRVEVVVESERFVATGKVVTRLGFREVLRAADDRNQARAGGGASTGQVHRLDRSDRTAGERGQVPPVQQLPVMQKGDGVKCLRATRRDEMTRPPAHFTEGTLIRAMEQVYKWVKDTEHRKLLREGDGIGTSATRAKILAELRRREFLVAQGKFIVSTGLGRNLVDALPEPVKDPALTALYERKLQEIEVGEGELQQFVQVQADFVRTRVEDAGRGALQVHYEGPAKSGAARKGAAARTGRTGVASRTGAAARLGHTGAANTAVESSPGTAVCHVCGTALRRRPAKSGKGFWWGCTAFPKCKQTYADEQGVPGRPYSKRTGTATSSRGGAGASVRRRRTRARTSKTS